MTCEDPLQWPQGWPRTPAHKRQRSRFEPNSLPVEARIIGDELYRLGARYPLITTNIAIRKDGLPYSARKRPDDPGVAVYFQYNGRQQCIPCDRWETVEENARAIWKSIEAMRGLDRWGAKSFVDAAFSGFQALPDPNSVAPTPWHEVLDVSPDASREEVERAYRRKVKEAHPDHGGSTEYFHRVQQAREEGLNHETR